MRATEANPLLGASEMGDLAGRSHEHITAIVNHAAQRHVEAVRTHGLGESVAATADRLSADVVRQRLSVEAMKSTAVYARVTRGAFEGLTPGSSIQIVADMDGTITTDPHDYLKGIPGSEVAEPLLAESGRADFAGVFARIWKEPLAMFPEQFKHVGKKATIREGTEDLFALAQDGTPVTILSANFAPIVEGVLGRIDGSENVAMHAITPESIRSTDKATMLRQIAMKEPERKLVYVGDGESDISAIKASDVVAHFFALEGSEFAAQLEQAGVAHDTYQTIYDVTSRLEELTALEAAA